MQGVTRDTFQPKTFHNVLIQTELGDFTPNPEFENSSTSRSPKKPNHISIRESLQRKDEYAVDLLSPSASASSSQPLLPNSISPPLPLPPPPPSSGACPDAGHPFSFQFVPPPPPPLPTLGLTSSPPVSELPGADYSSNHLVEYVPRKPVLEPTQPMKPLYWTRIQIQANKYVIPLNKLFYQFTTKCYTFKPYFNILKRIKVKVNFVIFTIHRYTER